MEKNQCLYHTDHENRIAKTEDSVSELYGKFNDVDKANTRLEVILENLSKLPEAIASLTSSMISIEKNMISMQGEIENNSDKFISLEKKLDGLKDKVGCIDDKDKISILELLKKNWFQIITFVGLLYSLLKKGM
jgi:chromosome segregation ATPase